MKLKEETVIKCDERPAHCFSCPAWYCDSEHGSPHCTVGQMGIDLAGHRLQQIFEACRAHKYPVACIWIDDSN